MFKIKVGKPTLRDLVEIQFDNRFNLYPVPFGEVSDLAEGNVYVVKRSVPWKGVKGAAYKKVKTRTGENLFEKQHIKSGLASLRQALHTHVGPKVEGVVIAQMSDGTYEIMPYWAALLSLNHINTKKKKRVIAIYNNMVFDTKDQALMYAEQHGLTRPGAVPAGRTVSPPTVSVSPS